jgi:xylose isomerase
MADPFAPQKSDKFTFGLWTVGNRGADPFGPVVRPHTSAPVIVEKLAKLRDEGVISAEDFEAKKKQLLGI